MRAGLIGLPSTGKTTLFQLLTGSAIETERTSGRGEASIGVAHVPDDRLDRLTELFRPRKRVPATVTLADMAARTGPSAGGQALVNVAPYREADALLHVVRAFADERVAHPSGSIDPARDTHAIEDELILADLAVAERRLERLERDRKKGVAAATDDELRVLRICVEALASGTPLRAVELEASAAKLLRGFQFLSAKPLLLVLNVDEPDAGRDLDDVIRDAGLGDALEGAQVRAVSVCAKIELEIAELDRDDAQAFMADLGLTETGLDRVVRAAYGLLGYISFFTTGDDECRAWSIPTGTVAQAAAGEIHTDLTRGFIRAEVVDYDHLISRGSLGACRRHGEVRLEGKDYVVCDGDVINVRFAT